MPANPAQRTPRKRPGDMTGRAKEKLVQDNADQIALQAEQMTMAEQARAVANSDVVDYTDEARPKPEPVPVVAVPVKPQKHKIRVTAPIEDMTFGKEIIDAGDVTDPNNPRMPVLGSLKYYSFEEGREYLVDHDMYEHLVELGYVYET
jgi:hypothetical protein